MHNESSTSARLPGNSRGVALVSRRRRERLTDESRSKCRSAVSIFVVEIVTAMIFTGTLIITVGALIQTAASRLSLVTIRVRGERRAPRIDGLTRADSSATRRRWHRTHREVSSRRGRILISAASRVPSLVVLARHQTRRDTLAPSSVRTAGDQAELTASFGQDEQRSGSRRRVCNWNKSRPRKEVGAVNALCVRTAP